MRVLPCNGNIYEHVAINEDASPRYPESGVQTVLHPKFPYEIEIYRPDFPHLIISTPIDKSSTKVRQISYVTVTVGKNTKGNTPKPAIQVHAEASAASKVVADVKFNTSPSTDITVYQSPELGSASEATHYKLSHDGVITNDVHHFTFPHRGTTIARFEWSHSGAKEVRDLATSNIQKENFSQYDRGLKLVMVDSEGKKTKDSDKILAVFSGGTRSGALNPRRIAGKLKFFEENIDVDDVDGFKLLVILSVLSMMERGRQHAMKNSEFFCIMS